MNDDIERRLLKWARVAGDVCPPAGKCMIEAAREIERMRWQRMQSIAFVMVFVGAAIAVVSLFFSLQYVGNAFG
jgi:hypothetical protein